MGALITPPGSIPGRGNQPTRRFSMRFDAQRFHPWSRICAAVLALALPALAVTTATGPAAHAANSNGCEGGRFRVLGQSGTFDGTVAAPTGRFTVQGTY